MKRNRFGDAVNSEIAENVAALRTRLFYAPAFECDLRKFFDVKEFRATQMIVSFFDPCVDAAQVDLRRNRGILRTLAVDVDLAIEFRELSLRGPQDLVHTETDRRACGIDPVRFVRQEGRAQASQQERG